MHSILPTRLMRKLVVLIPAIVLASCGGGDGQQQIPATPETPVTGVLLDAVVEGASWDTTSGLSGETNADGVFEYRPADMVTFSVGDIILGTLPGADYVTPVELTGSVDPTVPAALNQLIFLQSIDEDEDPTNGITISTATRAAAEGQSLDFNAEDFEAQVAAVVAAITDPDNEVVSSGEALANFYLTYVEFGGTDTFDFPFPGFPPVGEQLVLVFADEFNEGTVPDPDIWNYELGYGNWGWGNNEWQRYTDSTDNVRVEDGNLVINALCPVTPCGVRDDSITSGRITTQDKFEFRFGKIIARMKVPVGQGVWSAFWALGANFPDVGWPRSGEIDFMEVFNDTYNTAQESAIAQRTTTSAMHWCNEQIVPDPEASCFAEGGRLFSTDELTLAQSLADDFHIWEIDWTPNSVMISIDGVQYYEQPTTQEQLEEFRRDFFLLFNVAIGGELGSGGQPPQGDEVFPQTLLVDYVRVFEPGDVPPPVDENFIDFETLDASDVSALGNAGWLIFGSVFDAVDNFKFGFGAFPAPNNPDPPGWAAIVNDQGGPDQGSQQLSVFSDYNCCLGTNEGHFNGTDKVESNIFKEWTIGPSGGNFPSLGETLMVTFDAKAGNIAGATTAIAFIKTLDPNAGYSTTNFEKVDTTNLPEEWASYMLTLDLTDSLLEGQLLQIGFANTASNFEGSGVFYDNIKIETMPAAP